MAVMLHPIFFSLWKKNQILPFCQKPVMLQAWARDVLWCLDALVTSKLGDDEVMVQFGKVYIGRHKGWRNKFINAEVLFVLFLLKAASFIWFIAHNLFVLNKQIIRRFGLKKLCWGRGLNRVRVTGEYKLAVSANVTVSVMWQTGYLSRVYPAFTLWQLGTPGQP